ncbi:MAG: 30S ribosomal protein S6 [Patescibacteria group bacterium]
MSKEQQIDHTEQENDVKVYELGFHFVPTIAEDDVPVQFSHLKSMIEKRGGEFISEDFPKMIPLSYEISKTVKALKKRYNNAYFGWVKFTLAADQIGDLEKEVKAFEPILRYLVISTVKESTLVEPKEDRKLKEDSEGVVNEAQLDKKLEELAV